MLQWLHNKYQCHAQYFQDTQFPDNRKEGSTHRQAIAGGLFLGNTN